MWPNLQYDELGILPTVKDLLHDKLVVAGNAVVGHRLSLLPCGEVVLFNVLHMEDRGHQAWLHMRHVKHGRVFAACQLCHCSVVAVLGDVQRKLLPGCCLGL